MKKALALLGLCLLTLALAGAAQAMEFSADVVRKGHMGENTSKVYIKGNKVRMDNQQGPMGPGYAIVRQDQKVMWMVNPAQKSYMEMPLQGMADLSQHPRGDEKLPGEISRKDLGREVIDGHPCVKYEITHQQAGQNFVIHQWLAQDLKLPVKTAAVDGSWSVEYRNIKKGPQPDSLFEAPAGFQKMTMPAMGQGMGPGMGQGMRPGKGMGPGKGMRPGPGQGMPPGQGQDDD
ncbi:MAG: DUF4412 domain-containing protein [Desulfarculus sp.]|nr:DUF4412 domain-containing protein [Desulfarculus sp.]